MALVAVLDTTGRGTWWSWHLASMLARQDFEVTWVEADKAERTGMLLGPLPARDWLEGKLPGLAHLTPEVEPIEVLGHPIGLKLLPGCPPEMERPAGLDQALLAWARGREEWVVADLGGQHEVFADTIRHCDLLVVVTTPEGVATLRQLGETLRGRLPEQRRYAVIDERDRRTDRSFLRRRLPAAFRSAWLGGSPVVDVEPVADTEWCVGVAQWAQRQQDDGTPIFRLPPGDLEVPHAVVVQAKADWWRIAHRVARALGVVEDALPLEAPVEEAAPVVRFCVPDGVRARMEGDRSFERDLSIQDGGFLADPEDGLGVAKEQRPLADVLEELDCALILGEPGIGKTHESKRWEHRVELVGQPDFRREMDDLIAGGAEVLVLDAADEWTGTDAQLADQLGRWLDRQNPPPRLLIFGRSGDRMEALHAKLAGRYAEGRYRRLTLLPLRPRDVEPLAAGWIKASAAGMLGQVRALHIESLAARPLTLRMLAHLWARGQELPGDRVQVYRDGLEALVAHDEGDIGQVMKAARPLAWASILGGTARFRFGIPEAEGELNLHEIQRTFKEVSRADLEAALRTPIFARSEATWTFAHRSYAEYLAATFAVAQGRLSRRLMSLIEIEGMVPEQLSGLAGWLAALDAGVARALIAADPGRLLEQRAFVPLEVRAEWLEALVGAVREGRAHLWGHDLRVLLGPGVDGRARELAHDENQEIARNAVRLVAWGQEPVSTEWLVEQALSHGLPSGVRSEAVAQLATIPHRSALARLRPILMGKPAEDLRTALLQALWPEHLSALEFVLHLRTARDDRNWSLLFFLREHGSQIVEQLRPADLPEVLGWAAEHRHFSLHPPLGEEWPFSAALIQRAWDLAVDPTVAAALGGLLAAGFAGSASDGPSRLPVDWWDPDGRRKLGIVGGLLEALPSAQANEPWSMLGWAGLLPPLSDIISQAEAHAASNPDLAGRWLGLVRWEWPWSDEEASRIESVAHLNPAIVEWVNVRKDPPKRSERPPRPERLVRPSIEEEVQSALEQGRENPLWWMEVSTFLDVMPEGKEPRPDLNPDAEAEVMTLAARFLAHPERGWARWIRNWGFRSAARHAWMRCDPAGLPPEPEVVHFWAATFMADADPEATDVSLRATVESIGGHREEVARFALKHAPYEAHKILPWVLPFWEPAWEAQARSWLEKSLPKRPYEQKPKNDEERRAANERRNARGLLRYSQERLFKGLLAKPEAHDALWAWGLERLRPDWVIASLFESNAPKAWEALLPRFMRNERTARAIALAIGGEKGFWEFGDEVAADVYARLRALFPPPEPSKDYRVRPRDRVMDLISALLGQLVERGAVEQVSRLSWEFKLPGVYLRNARRARAKRSWKALSIIEAAAFERRLRTSADLLDRVDEAFEDIEKDLNGELAAWDAFFDHAHERQDKRTWPKHETTACTLLADRLRSKLSGLSFKALNVEPQEVGGQDRIDIKLEVPGEEGNPLTLKVEVKWATNTDKEKGVEAAMESQLVDRYLNHPEDLAGLYLVLWPGPLTGADVPALWRNDPDRLDKLLQAQAAQLRAQHPHQPLRARVLRLGARRSSAASK
jgi:hypothetical protein